MYNRKQAELAPCTRDLEQEAKRCKISIDTLTTFVAAMELLVDMDEIYQIDETEDRKTLFAIYGAFKLKIPQKTRRYEQLLKKLEEEK